MKAVRPHDLPVLFLEALNSGNVASVLSLYEPEGVIAPDPNKLLSGRAAIQTMVSILLIQRPHFVLHEFEAVEAGDIALIRSK